MPKKISYEAALRRLEQIVEQLESGEIPLSRTLQLYREGLEKYQLCLEQLNQVEEELKLLIIDPETGESREET